MFGKSLVAVALAAVAIAQDITIESPASLVQCQPTLIKWSKAPAFVSIIPGNDATGAALIDFGEQQGTQLTWTVNITAGTSITYKVVSADSGEMNFNSAVTVQPGSDSCLNGGAAAGGSASSAAASGASAASGAASSAVASASSAASSATSSAAGAVSSASSAVQSAAAGASSAANSAASGARNSASSAVNSAASGAASATPSGAASPFAVADIKTGAIAVFLGALGLTVF